MATKRVKRTIAVSRDFEKWFRYQTAVDDITRDELIERALIAYWRACRKADNGVPVKS